MSFFKRYRLAFALFAACASFLIGGALAIRAIATPATQVFPADGHIAIDYISGHRAYAVWHNRPGTPACAVTFRADGSALATDAADAPAGHDDGEAMRFLTRFDLLKEGAYDIRVTGLAPGETAVLVETNAFVWIIPSMVCGAMAFACFLGGALAAFVAHRRTAA